MRFYIFILASVEPCSGAVCWIQERFSPGGNFYIWLSGDVSITAHKCLSFSRYDGAAETPLSGAVKELLYLRTSVVPNVVMFCLRHHIPCSTSVFWTCTASCGCAWVFLGCHVLLFVFLSIGIRPTSQSGGLNKVCAQLRDQAGCVWLTTVSTKYETLNQNKHLGSIIVSWSHWSPVYNPLGTELS